MLQQKKTTEAEAPAEDAAAEETAEAEPAEIKYVYFSPRICRCHQSTDC